MIVYGYMNGTLKNNEISVKKAYTILRENKSLPGMVTSG